MKKSDVAIYISAILTLVLTTFVVFSTQKVSYETKADEILKSNNLATNEFALAKDPTTASDAGSPMFNTKLPNADIADTEVGDVDLSIVKEPNEKSSLTIIPEPSIREDAAPKIETRVQKSPEPIVRDTKVNDKAVLFDDEAVNTATIEQKPTQSNKVALDPAPSVSSSSGKTYTVKYGDMLRTIAARHGTTTLKLIQANNLSNPDLIFPGQIIRLP